MRKLLQVSERVWIVPPQWKYVEPTIGFVLTDEGVVAIDSGNSPDHARRALAALRAVTDLPITYLINTHRHWDHTFGNQIFAAPVIAHALTKRKMLANMRDDWSPEQLMNWVSGWVLKMVPTLQLEQFAGLRVVLPQITFTGRLELSVGKTVVRLLYAGGGHTRDSIIVHLPREQLVFLSDALYPNPEGKITTLAALFAKIERLGAEKFIPGHELPYDREKFALRAEYYRALVQTARALRRRKDGMKRLARMSLDPRYAQINGLTEQRHRQLLEQAWHEL
uniref:Metallo-beta-lactamase family protein n=1 Tax=Acetithermum autotrophicum TaxID=1446466 RepID=H5SU93_ACEAU|nr:metallo-beta-lactamase family protein [Candidatus Acetothermum autotrophicum]